MKAPEGERRTTGTAGQHFHDAFGRGIVHIRVGVAGLAPAAPWFGLRCRSVCPPLFLPLPRLSGISLFPGLPLPADPPDLGGTAFPFALSLAAAVLHSVSRSSVLPFAGAPACPPAAFLPAFRPDVLPLCRFWMRVRNAGNRLVMASPQRRIPVCSAGCVWIQPRCRLDPCRCVVKLRQLGGPGDRKDLNLSDDGPHGRLGADCGWPEWPTLLCRVMA